MPSRIFGHLLVVFLALSTTCWGETSYLYRLGSESYSPNANAFLFSVTVDSNEPLQLRGLKRLISWLAIYEPEAKRVSRVGYPTGTAFFDWAWVPGQEAFVVAGSDRMVLYRKDASGGFSGAAISCPVDTLYLFCSWDPKGRWLAVTCNDVRIGKGGFKLGLYDLKEDRYVMTNTAMKPRRPVWEDGSRFYINTDRGVLTPDGGVKEMRLSPRMPVPMLWRTVPLEEGVSRFYGVIDGQPLTRKDKEIRLGDKTLAELDLASDRRVAITETTIFVSASSTNVIAFDRNGREVGKANPGRVIHLGPSGKDPDIVYGLTGSLLQYVCRGKDTVDVRDICDLGEFRY